MDKSELDQLSRWPAMTEADFDRLLAKFIDRPVAYFSDYDLVQRITVSQAATEILLNEFEARGLLVVSEDGSPCVPYVAPDSRVTESILTRE